MNTVSLNLFLNTFKQFLSVVLFYLLFTNENEVPIKRPN